ncbi:hypothetical protein MMC19_004800 [Ptychographa xylographoides]|nr:hypothetical protein [Ptychographa xylographoides]
MTVGAGAEHHRGGEGVVAVVAVREAGEGVADETVRLEEAGEKALEEAGEEVQATVATVAIREAGAVVVGGTEEGGRPTDGVKVRNWKRSCFFRTFVSGYRVRMKNLKTGCVLYDNKRGFDVCLKRE